jgi:phosphopantetheine--protein transferase-like protein
MTMKPDVVLGNDVVDLKEPRSAAKATDERFVARVLTAAERAGLARSDDPNLELWSLWAAKEAAYKVVSKLRGEPPVFEHAAFVSSWSLATPRIASESEVRSGVVRHGNIRVSVSVIHRAGVLHAVAHTHRTPTMDVAVQVGLERLDDASAPWAGGLDQLLRRFTPRETEAIHSVASAAVRIGARRALAALAGVDERRLEIVCRPGIMGRRPPFVMLDGREAAADVSLSHAGGWIGWALWSHPDLGLATAPADGP